MNDKWARLIGIPFVSLAFALIYHADTVLRFEHDLFVVMLPPFLFTLFLWEGNRYIFLVMRRQFPTHVHVGKRLVVQ